MQEGTVYLTFKGQSEAYLIRGVPRIGEKVVLKGDFKYRVKDVQWEQRTGNRLVPFVELEIDKK